MGSLDVDEERVSSPESPIAQPIEENPTFANVTIRLIVALVEEPVERTFGRKKVEPRLATVSDLAVEKMITHLPPLSTARSPVSRG